MRKELMNSNAAKMIRAAGVEQGLNSLRAIAQAAGIPYSTMYKRMLHFECFSAGELNALMRVLPSINNEMMGKAIREAATD